MPPVKRSDFTVNDEPNQSIAAIAVLACVSYTQGEDPEGPMVGHSNPPAGGTGSDLSAESVREQLSKILRSRTFVNAPSLSRLLHYLVDHAIQGNTEQLKEYVVGVEALDRKASFDPRTDTIVRVHARRLRSKLEDYYNSEGRADPIIVGVPKGGYLAVFRTAPLRGNISVLLPVETPGRIANPRSLPLPLPAPRTPLIGRERERAGVRKLLLNENVRLVTLTGVGGSGKTRLGLQVAADLSGAFSGGIYFAALASISDPGDVVSEIAQLFGVRHTGGQPLAAALQERLQLLASSPTLLLLDNFEHLLPAAPLVADLLDACAALKILTTSRALLHVYGEHEYPVPPLAVPNPKQLPPPEKLSRSPAVALFIERAVAVQCNFVLTPENAQDVAKICVHLEGLPLAIELAAAHVKMLTPATLLSRLKHRFEILTDGPVDLPARQQTLRKTVEWSHALLSPPEQKLFRRLSVFAGGCTIESAEAACNTRLDLGIDVLAGITSLVDKSLLQRIEQGDDRETRFLMLETIREYALEKLAASGETEAVKHAHAAYCLVLAEEGNAQLSAADQASWLALCDTEHENLRAAIDVLIETENTAFAIRFGLALFAFWELREHLAEGRERIKAILNMRAAAPRTAERARLLSYAGTLATSQGDLDPGVRLHRESLEIYRELGNKKGIAAELNALGFYECLRGNYAVARSWLEQCLSVCRQLGDSAETAAALSNLADVASIQGEHSLANSLLEEALSGFRELGDWTGVAWSLNHLGDVARQRGELTESNRFYHESMDLFQRVGDRWGFARSSVDLGYLACEQGDVATAYSCFQEALHIFLSLEHKRGVAKVLEAFAFLAAHQGNAEQALTLAGAAAALRRRIEAPSRPADQARLTASLRQVWRQDDFAAQPAWMNGWMMPLEQAIQMCSESGAKSELWISSQS